MHMETIDHFSFSGLSAHCVMHMYFDLEYKKSQQLLVFPSLFPTMSSQQRTMTPTRDLDQDPSSWDDNESVLSAANSSGGERRSRSRRRRNRRRRNGNQATVTQQVEKQETVTKANNEDGGHTPLKLRLDLNLDVEIELRARVHGDVTLALLS